MISIVQQTDQMPKNAKINFRYKNCNIQYIFTLFYSSLLLLQYVLNVAIFIHIIIIILLQYIISMYSIPCSQGREYNGKLVHMLDYKDFLSGPSIEINTI